VECEIDEFDEYLEILFRVQRCPEIHPEPNENIRNFSLSFYPQGEKKNPRIELTQYFHDTRSGTNYSERTEVDVFTLEVFFHLHFGINRKSFFLDYLKNRKMSVLPKKLRTNDENKILLEKRLCSLDSSFTYLYENCNEGHISVSSLYQIARYLILSGQIVECEVDESDEYLKILFRVQRCPEIHPEPNENIRNFSLCFYPQGERKNPQIELTQYFYDTRLGRNYLEISEVDVFSIQSFLHQNFGLNPTSTRIIFVFWNLEKEIRYQKG
jgi:hypothetical protein